VARIARLSILVFSLLWLLVEGAGIPLLSEGAFGPLGMLVHQGYVNGWTAFLLAWGATVVGNTIGFLLFSYYGPALMEKIESRWPSITKVRQKVEPFAKRQIFVAITVTRFLGLGSFQVVLWMAGLLGTPAKLFLPYLYALNLIWTAAWLFGSKWVIQWVLRTLKPDSPAELVGLGAGAIALVWLIHAGAPKVWQLLRRGRHSTEES
jgi:membrane protein DedA with SNARE-associated domain